MKKILLVFTLLAFTIIGLNAQTPWYLTGNSGTNPSSNFIGTTDNNPLIFKTGRNERMQLLPNKSFLGIGVSIPQATLHLHYQQDFGTFPTLLKLLQLTTDATGNGDGNGFSIVSDFNTKDIHFQQNEEAKFFVEGPAGGFVIAPEGKIGIGTADPAAPLHLHVTNAAEADLMQISSGANCALILSSTPAANSMTLNYQNRGKGAGSKIVFTPTGSVDIYQEPANYPINLSSTILNVNGDASFSGVLTQTLSVAQSANFSGELNAQSATIKGSSLSNGFTISYNSNNLFLKQKERGKLYLEGVGGGLCIAEDGYLGLGTDKPHQKLHVVDGNILISKTSSKAPQSSNGSILFGDNITDSCSMGKWAIEYLNGEDDAFGLNFWKPWNANCGSGYGNYFLFLANTGNIGIGTKNPGTKLDVIGNIRAHEVKVCLNQGCDYVFEDGYKLMNLSDLRSFIKTNKHLPDVAPAAEMEAEGINLSEMNALLLRKVEELTLYILQMEQRVSELENKKGGE